MTDTAAFNPTVAPSCRSPLIDIDHNIVHSPKQRSKKIESGHHEVNAAPEQPVARYSIKDGDKTSDQFIHEHPTIDLSATHLVSSSPYPDFANQLRLGDLETPFRLFAFAMSILRPIRDDYATAPYLESFNWSEVFALLRSLCKQTGFQWNEFGFYVVIFRSKLLESADRERLGLLDQKSHEEACASGGLLKYWFGSTDSERRNLATCLWRHREDASLGGGGPWHKQARASARVM